MGETLIGFKDTPDFAVRRYQVHGGEINLYNAPAIYVVTAGEGKIIKNDFSRELNRGDYFFLPFKANGSLVSSSFNLELVECLPPSI
jgi:mannose-6-phosphate isomerase class I